jgi:Holliday junction resolvase RusA-like endonuclease
MTTMRIAFFVAGIPQTQGSMRAVIPRGRTYPVVIHDEDKALRGWRSSVAAEAAMAKARTQIAGLLDGPVSLGLDFVLLAPKGRPMKPIAEWTARQIREYAWPDHRPDVDKLARSILDSLVGVLLRDDGQVVQLWAGKIYGDAPGVTVTLQSSVIPQKDAVPSLIR